MKRATNPSDAERKARQELQPGDSVVVFRDDVPYRAVVTSRTACTDDQLVEVRRLDPIDDDDLTLLINDPDLICTSDNVQLIGRRVLTAKAAHEWNKNYAVRRAKYVSAVSTAVAEPVVKPKVTRFLSEDMGDLLKSGLYSDAILRSSDGKEFPVHRNVLAARSDVWKADFEFQVTATAVTALSSSSSAAATAAAPSQFDVKSKPSATLDVAFPSQVVEILLRYAYTGGDCSLSRQYTICKDVLLASDMYELDILFATACNSITRTIDPSNVCDLLNLLAKLSATCSPEKASYLMNIQTGVEGWILNNIESVAKLLTGTSVATAAVRRKRNDAATTTTSALDADTKEEPVSKKQRPMPTAATALPLSPLK